MQKVTDTEKTIYSDFTRFGYSSKELDSLPTNHLKLLFKTKITKMVAESKEIANTFFCLFFLSICINK